MSVRLRPVEHLPCGLPLVTRYVAFGLDPIPLALPEPDGEVIDLRTLGKVAAPPAYRTLYRVLFDYIHEHCVPNTANERRAAGAAWDWLEALGSDFDVRTITRAHGRTVIEHLQRRGLKSGSVRRVMSVGTAAFNHEKREGRLTGDVPTFPRVRGSSARVRCLSREEHRRLMQAPMSKRLHDFYVIAFGTGARPAAIEELTPRRVDFAQGTIDFRIPGRDHKNKRRVVVPIIASLLPRLQRMCEGKDLDEPVIGFGPSGRITELYHQASDLFERIGMDDGGMPRHVARHTVVSWMLQGDPERGIPPAPIHKVAAFVGDRVAMIEKNYAHLMPKDLLEATRILP